MNTKLVVPPMPELDDLPTWALWPGKLKEWGQECAAIAQREAALVDELAEALELAGHNARHFRCMACAAFAKHKEARNG